MRPTEEPLWSCSIAAGVDLLNVHHSHSECTDPHKEWAQVCESMTSLDPLLDPWCITPVEKENVVVDSNLYVNIHNESDANFKCHVMCNFD